MRCLPMPELHNPLLEALAHALSFVHAQHHGMQRNDQLYTCRAAETGYVNITW